MGNQVAVVMYETAVGVKQLCFIADNRRIAQKWIDKNYPNDKHFTIEVWVINKTEVKP